MDAPELILDDEGLALLRSRAWWFLTRKTKGGKVYRYLEAKVDGRRVLFHRVLMGATAGVLVDHINGNTLDNRRCNLRFCTHAENMRNRAINANHAHGFKGVGRGPSGLYYAQIRAGKVRRMRRGFATPEEAAAAYAAFAAELHGEFARTDCAR